MIRILSDTSTMYASAEAEAAGFYVSPLSVTIAGKSYREFDEITAEEFVDLIRQGHMPTSSQPAIGEVVSLYERFREDEILNISMAAGLSGTYSTATAAAQLCDHGHRITVVNSGTLCGPHRYLVELAVRLAQAGHSCPQILEVLHQKMATAKSYLLPEDFDYLRRGGRLSPLVSHVGKTAHLCPVMTQTPNGERLTVASIRRGFKHSVQYIAEQMKRSGVGQGWQIQISHAAAPEKAQNALTQLQAVLPEANCQIFPLSPAFITQGGPGCIAIQCIQM